MIAEDVGMLAGLDCQTAFSHRLTKIFRVLFQFVAELGRRGQEFERF